MGGTPGDPVAAGREALDRHAWDQAYDLLTEADRTSALTGADLRLLAEATYWSGHPDETVRVWERAFAAFMHEHDHRSASMAAFRVGEQYGMRGAMPQAQGWATRAQRLAEGDPDWEVHGWLTWMTGLLSWFQSNFEAAVASYDVALELAERSGDQDLYWMTLHDKGHSLCLLGRVEEGMGLLDEAMVAVVGGELGPEAAGYVYCGMIGICSKLGDYGRAAEWTDATLRWCERESVPAFPGICRIHKAELKLLHGSLGEAEEEARLACEELPRFNLTSGLGPAHYAIGEVRRRRGDERGAEESYALAHGFGFDPQPGLSLLRLAQGNQRAAAAGIREALLGAGDNRCQQVRLLAAQVEIALAGHDLITATSAVDEFDTAVGAYGAPALEALAAQVRGSVLLTQGDVAGAVEQFHRAQRGWQEVGAPFEVAEVRLLLGEALRTRGDDDAATLEWRAARSVFEQLGAGPAAERAGRLLEGAAASHPSPDRVTRAFMFTDIVKSTDLVGVIGDEAWEALLAWHDQALRSLFAAHGGGVAHHTGDGFFVAFEDVREALACAVAVQRTLAEHRRAHGFAPFVRIGVHAAEATRRGEDYSGREVHKAARIAALAQSGEILVSTDSVPSDDHEFTMAEPREVTVKGVTEPIPIARLDWR